MAHIANRSRFRVSVRNKPELTQHFSHDKITAVQAYMVELRTAGYKPKAEQLDESWLVRIRNKGHKPVEATFGSQSDATHFVNKTAEERKRGLFVDYTAGLKVTFADLIVRYLLDEAWKAKSGKVLAYSLEGWLADSGPKGQEMLSRYRDELRTRGREVRGSKFAMRQSSTELAWIHKRLAEVTTVDIEHFINERLEVVDPSTVDREIDRLKAIYKVALTVWDYNLAKNPMDAVRRPRFFNERDRRISPEEEARLLDALAKLDHERAVETRLKELSARALEGQSFSSASARKKVLATVRAELRGQAEAEADVEPLLQAFYQFQVMTAARRGETLGLTWDRVDTRARTALLPETKNGRARKLALRSDLLDILQQLPRPDGRVFPIRLDYLVGAWGTACARACIDDLHIHDCRHEALSRLAESGKFTIPELQVFSGHRDVRMLMRYAHLCASRLAAKLDECFKDESKVRLHRGRKVLNRNAAVKMSDVLAATPPQHFDDQPHAPEKSADAAQPPTLWPLMQHHVGGMPKNPQEPTAEHQVSAVRQLRGWRWARRAQVVPAG